MIKNFNFKTEQFKQNSSFKISKIFKKQYLTYLNSADTSNSKLFFKQHTKNIDKFLYQIFLYIKQSSNSINKNSFISFVALGSYARVELCLHSDIDIMILYKNSSSENVLNIIEKFVAFAWDCGLNLGLRVVNIDELEEIKKLAQEDVTIKTSILEARYIFGSKNIYKNFEKFLYKLRQIDKKKFVQEQITRHQQRLVKYPLNMQVNVKEGYGGIREANMLFWISNILYDVQKTKYLVGIKFDYNEFRKYSHSLDFIFQTRNALHTIHKKKVDTITFDVLPELSRKLGFKNEFDCMHKLFSSLHTIHNFYSNMGSKFLRKMFFESSNIRYLKSSRIKKGIYFIDNTIYCSFNRKAVTLSNLLKEIVSLPTDIKKFDRSYIYFASKTKIPKNLSKTTKKDIKHILCNQNLYPILKLLYNAELISFVIPSFKKIINLSQFDGYHKHPVDIHSLQTLKYTQSIEDSFVQEIYNDLNKEEQILTRLVALFHDIGKGRKKDHHIIGENLFKKILKSFGFDDEFIKLGANIIKYHDQMSRTATNEDIYSQKAILNFIGLFKNINEVKILYVLTYCDICAVNKSLYNSTTAILIQELYKKSSLAFEDPELIKESIVRVSKLNRIKTLPQYKELPNSLRRAISQISSNQIFLRLKSTDILDIAIKAKDVSSYTFDIINDNYLQIRIIRKNPLNLGYLLGKLQYLDMNSMNIFKLYDDKKDFEITFSKPALEEELYLIEEIINESFDMKKSISLKKPVIKRKDIKIDCNHTESLASMKINTKDQKGLFAYIAKVFDDFGIEIESAKLITSKGYAKDLFLIEKNGNFCKNVEKILDLICS